MTPVTYERTVNVCIAVGIVALLSHGHLGPYSWIASAIVVAAALVALAAYYRLHWRVTAALPSTATSSEMGKVVLPSASRSTKESAPDPKVPVQNVSWDFYYPSPNLQHLIFSHHGDLVAAEDVVKRAKFVNEELLKAMILVIRDEYKPTYRYVDLFLSRKPQDELNLFRQSFEKLLTARTRGFHPARRHGKSVWGKGSFSTEEDSFFGVREADTA